MKKNDSKQYAIAFYRSIDGLQGKKLAAMIKTFAEFLAKKHKMGQAKKIINEFIAYAKKQEGITQAQIITARKTQKSVMEKVIEIFGEKSEITEKINPEILGGVIIKTEDKIIDASLKTQILNLKKNLL